MASVNKVILIGNVGGDPEVKELPSGDKLVNLSVATNEKWKDKEGNSHEQTEWHKVSLFRHSAAFAEGFIKKGMSIYIEGKISYREWQTESGETRNITSINASDVKIVSSKNQQSPDAKPAESMKQSLQAAPKFDDDIPF